MNQVHSTRWRLKTSWTVVRDPLRRSRLRWFLLGWIIAIPTVLMGAGLTVAGAHLVLAKGPFVIYAKIPGGLHTHGIALLVLGLALVMGLSAPAFGNPEPRTWLRRTLIATSYYYAWSVVMLALAPVVDGGAFSYLATISWATFAALPVVLLVGPPPTLVLKNETDLIRAAIEAGVTPEHARRLADSYLHPGGLNGGPDAA